MVLRSERTSFADAFLLAYCGKSNDSACRDIITASACLKVGGISLGGMGALCVVSEIVRAVAARVFPLLSLLLSFSLLITGYETYILGRNMDTMAMKLLRKGEVGAAGDFCSTIFSPARKVAAFVKELTRDSIVVGPLWSSQLQC